MINTKNNIIENPAPKNGIAHSAHKNRRNNLHHSILNKFSLIIPVFQEEKILEQTLSKFDKNICDKFNIELIISDGGSQDDTLNIAKNFTDKIVVHNQEHKQTIAEGRNKGAEIANSNVLVFMNGDTFPANVEKFFSFIIDWANGETKFDDCIALTCWVSVEPEQMLLKDKIFYALHNRYINFLNFIGMGMGRGECQIVRKEIFRRIGGYDNNLAAGEDFDLFRRLAKIGKIGFVKDLIVYESPRRFRKYGYSRVLLSWFYNSISVIFRGKSISRVWEAVR